MIEYNGVDLLVKSSGSPFWREIKKIAESSKYPSVYAQTEGTWYIRGTKRNAWALAMLGIDFSPEASVFLNGKKDPVKEIEDANDYSVLAKNLHPFQREGVEWLGKPGNKLLADEMGLGKTIQIAALFRFHPELLPALIVCPASLKINWKREIEQLSGIKAMVLYGRQPYDIAGEVRDYPAVIVNYDITGYEDAESRERENSREQEMKSRNLPYRKKQLPVRGWCETLSKIPFNSLICDEVQFIAGHTAIRARAVIKICGGIRNVKKIFVSGTPYENRTSQFFTCLNLLSPSLFPNRWRFLMNYCDPVKTYWGWKFDGLSNGETLHNLVKPLMLRRLKKDVLKELPPKQRFVVPMELDKPGREIYGKMEERFESGLGKGGIPSFSGMKTAAYHAKRDSAIQWIKDYLEAVETKKLVVFFWHKAVLEDLKSVFGKQAVVLTGETPLAGRQEAVDRFQSDSGIQVFLGQIEAAGTGITLTASPATVFAEFGESAAQHIQAEDRVHRISQEADSVFAYYLVAPGTVEEDIMGVLEDREMNQRKVLDGGEGSVFFGEASGGFNNRALALYKKRKGIGGIKEQGV